MNIIMFYHSLVSDWNNSNAHFLRGLATELIKRGHDVQVNEAEDGWSYRHLLKLRGNKVLEEFKNTYPLLSPNFYSGTEDFKDSLERADLVIVHEWNSPQLVKQIGKLRKKYGFALLFHDTNDHSVLTEDHMREIDLSNYDGVLACGNVIRDIYLKNGWADNAWTWHQAADIRIFQPPNDPVKKKGNVAWVGDWSDEDRTEELREFLIEPVKKLRLKTTVYGVRYPQKALKILEDAGIEYGGYVASYQVPVIFAGFDLTVHIPRRSNAEALPGIPTIRPFEAMACGIPMISAPWKDTENLFREGLDYKMVNNGEEMAKWMQNIMAVEDIAEDFKKNGYETIHAKHTCSHRAEELLAIYKSL